MAKSNKKSDDSFGLFVVIFSLIFGSLYGLLKIFQGTSGEAEKVFSGIVKRGLRCDFTEDQIITSIYSAVQRFKNLSEYDAKKISKFVHNAAGTGAAEYLPLDDTKDASLPSAEKFIDYATDVLFSYEKTHNPELKRVTDTIDEGLSGGLTEDLVFKNLERLSVSPPTAAQKEKIKWMIRLESRIR
jgi:hypothetical protein